MFVSEMKGFEYLCLSSLLCCSNIAKNFSKFNCRARMYF